MDIMSAPFALSRLTVHEHRVAADMGDVPDIKGWDQLAALATEPNAFLEPWFIRPALRYLRDGQLVRLLEIRSSLTPADDSLIAVIPLAIGGRYGRIPIRHVVNWTHYQCFYGAPLIRAGMEMAVWKAVLDHLDHARWAPGFLSISGLDMHGPVLAGLQQAAQGQERSCAIVHQMERAMLASTQSASAYAEASLRGKKRKELRRLRGRLEELGAVEFRQWQPGDDLEYWCDAFLRLEQSGWKGQSGAALDNNVATSAFFREMIHACAKAGRLDFQRLDLAGQPIAMLVNFTTPPGSYSFKIAYDEDLARFSPGVMIEIENLRVQLDRPDPRWMDSCAVADHPMIDRLWRERRTIAQVTVPLAGFRRRALHAACRSAERLSATLRRLKSGDSR